MTARVRDIPVCRDCYGDVQTEPDGFYCVPCQLYTPYAWAIFIQDKDDDDD